MPNFPEDDAIITVFKAITSSERLRSKLILKGGNALAQVFSGIRASVDLDFTGKDTYEKVTREILEKTKDELCDELQKSLDQVVGNSKFAHLVVQKSIIRPPGEEKPTFPAIEIRIGYSEIVERMPPFMDVVKVEISLNDLICEEVIYQVEGNILKVSSINDIIAEKLRALIQQIPRNRNRPNDVFDIWFFHKNASHLLDYDKISEFLVKKSIGRFPKDNLVRKETFFKNEELRSRAVVGFEAIEERVTNISFPSFDVAFQEVINLVEKLSIPD